MEATKIDEFTIQVTKETVQTVVQNYDYNFLIAQKKAIEEDRAKYIEQRDKELEEVDALIKECKRLKIKPKEEKEIDER